MTNYILTALRFNQVLERNDQGRPIKEIRHRQGALVTDLDELEAQRLLRAGAIRPADEVTDEATEDPDVNTGGDTVGGQAPLQGDETPVSGSGGRLAEKPRKPRATATDEKWVAYAEAIGIDDADLDGKNKDEIIALVDAAEAK
ncbi:MULTISPECIES: lipase chaperone [Rhodococcus]|uniref:lipase chaperone n=1 Tax=Rhodococcus TaxID=1827 RepID=UPI00143EF416|nr:MULTISPECIES: lipase chaperone [Rhodococcus]QIX48933.1 lipase chaperone [Rhodococcus sp. DMU1]QRI76016.1 lipase chaperone [Rhodococcus aetherivorans]QSE59427.1 lipase chaperone [Rhodococcus sp. PSBB066]QSE69248.1 lipase chaperone [Rhodococcus sp. PSBB049]